MSRGTSTSRSYIWRRSPRQFTPVRSAANHVAAVAESTNPGSYVMGPRSSSASTPRAGSRNGSCAIRSSVARAQSESSGTRPQEARERPIGHLGSLLARRLIGEPEVNAEQDARIHYFLRRVGETPERARLLRRQRRLARDREREV